MTYGRPRLQLGLPMQAAADHLGVSLTTISRTERGIKPNHEFAATYRSWLDTLTLTNAA